MPPTLRAPLAALALTLLLTGCSSDASGEPESKGTTSASPDGTSAAASLVQTGLDQLASGDDEGASKTFNDVLALDPTNVYGHYNLGVIAQQAGNDEAAMAEYDRALSTDDAFAPALFNKGILTESTDLDDAVDLYRRAVAADPTMAAAFMRLGFALLHLGKKDEGAKYLGRGVKLDPSMADVEAPSYD